MRESFGHRRVGGELIGQGRPLCADEGDVGKRARLAIIIVIGFVLFGLPVVLARVGARQVEQEEARINARSATARISADQLLGAMFSTDGADAITKSLGVDVSDVSYSQVPPNWCLRIDFERLIAKGHLRYIVHSDGTLHPTSSC
jgi:hypothetical protein